MQTKKAVNQPSFMSYANRILTYAARYCNRVSTGTGRVTREIPRFASPFAVRLPVNNSEC